MEWILVKFMVRYESINFKTSLGSQCGFTSSKRYSGQKSTLQAPNSQMPKINSTGDEIPDQEASLIVSNHPSEADFLFWSAFAVRKGILGTMRIIAKDVQSAKNLFNYSRHSDFPLELVGQ
jgi:hypothetical protein